MPYNASELSGRSLLLPCPFERITDDSGAFTGMFCTLSEGENSPMAYDSPKAAHFNAYDTTGRLLAWNDATGVAACWKAANLLKELGIDNMLGLSWLGKQLARHAAAETTKATGIHVVFIE